ncbi:MAG: response regulator, partial [Desulfobulbaceae bacterium]|nr:response regulator [Desulfobulbaceae bacterium]
ILAAILGNASLAGHILNPDHEVCELLSEIAKASLRAKDLTQQLLTFSKGGDPIKTTATITDVIKDSADFVISGANAKCAYEIPNHLWAVKIDKGQISQVIQNLIVNANHAMPDGGIIKVSCENFVKKKTDALPIADGNYIKLIISDTGSGVPFRLLSKIFDPYFTTKKEGSGLGLAVCYSIINKHDGHISVESIEGEGTSFTIYLPALEEIVPSQQVNHAPVLSGKGKILVMDDDEMVRNMAQRMLSTMGYEVFLVSDGSEAIDSYQNAMDSDSPFDAVTMDLTIPGGMGGEEAGRKLLVIDPDVRIIISSGYSNDPIMACHLDYGFKAAVAKPFQMNELSLALESVLTVEQSA